jgi:hypothetical protein
MTHDLTTNARVLHDSLDKLRTLKDALGFKTMYQTVEYVVNQVYDNPAHAGLLSIIHARNKLDAQRQELIAKQAQLLA